MISGCRLTMDGIVVTHYVPYTTVCDKTKKYHCTFKTFK